MRVPDDFNRCLVEVAGRFVVIVMKGDRGHVSIALVPEAKRLDGARFGSIKAAMRAAEKTIGAGARGRTPDKGPPGE